MMGQKEETMDIRIAPRGINATDLDQLTIGAIVTHQWPDWDAIGAVYFAQKIIAMQGADALSIVLVPAGTPASATPRAIAVVDTGAVFEPRNLRLDHHQNLNNDTSATALAGDEYCERAGDNAISITQRAFVNVITAADLGRSTNGAKESRESGLHALLSAWKFRRMPDEEMMWRGMCILEAIQAGQSIASLCAAWPEDMAGYAAARAVAAEEYARCLVYSSNDGKVVALDGAGALASQEAYATGAELVVFHNARTGAVGISRAGEARTPHVGDVLAHIANVASYDAALGNIGAMSNERQVAIETEDWFRHPAGFYAGLSPKADNVRPLGLSLATIATAIDTAWSR